MPRRTRYGGAWITPTRKVRYGGNWITVGSNTEAFSFGAPSNPAVADTDIYWLGVTWASNVTGLLVAVDWYTSTIAPTIQAYVQSWNDDTGVALHGMQAVTVTPGQLNRFTLATPIAITTGVTYVTAVHTNRYAATPSYSWPYTGTAIYSGNSARFINTTSGNSVRPTNTSSSNYHVSPVVEY